MKVSTAYVTKRFFFHFNGLMNEQWVVFTFLICTKKLCIEKRCWWIMKLKVRPKFLTQDVQHINIFIKHKLARKLKSKICPLETFHLSLQTWQKPILHSSLLRPLQRFNYSAFPIHSLQAYKEEGFLRQLSRCECVWLCECETVQVTAGSKLVIRSPFRLGFFKTSRITHCLWAAQLHVCVSPFKLSFQLWERETWCIYVELLQDVFAYLEVKYISRRRG